MLFVGISGAVGFALGFFWPKQPIAWDANQITKFVFAMAAAGGAIGGPLVALKSSKIAQASLRMTKEERSAAMRNALSTRQTDLYTELSRTYSEFAMACSSLRWQVQTNPGAQENREKAIQANEFCDQLWKLLIQMELFAEPDIVRGGRELYSRCAEFHRAIWECNRVDNQDAIGKSLVAELNVFQGYTSWMEAVRHSARITELTEQNMKVVAAPERPYKPPYDFKTLLVGQENNDRGP